ncbi:MAG: 4Fe-4S binding protein [Candidatus Omnitrophica bacterium]|nr:4Fe-4S binding protein [Candidatus Omnitrophota bacterium]
MRQISQTVFFFLFIYIIWSATYQLKGPLSPRLIFDADPLLTLSASIGSRVIIPGISLSLIILFMTAVLGRFFCGWICPLGSTMDLIASFKKRKAGIPDSKNKKLRRPKFYIFGLIGLSAVMGTQIAWLLDPLVITERFLSLTIRSACSLLGKGANFSPYSIITLIFFAVICSMAIFLSRFWCRAICPLGALYAVMARFSILRRIVVECKDCGNCKSSCRMGAIKDDASYVKSECILCMDCIYDCSSNSTSFGWGDKKTRNFLLDKTH